MDTGFPKKYADNTAAAAAEDGLGAFGEVLTLTSDNLPEGQLRKLGPYTAARLMDLAAKQDAFIIYGHAPDQWPTLRKAPQVYR